jgi:hypothetical protein
VPLFWVLPRRLPARGQIQIKAHAKPGAVELVAGIPAGRQCGSSCRADAVVGSRCGGTPAAAVERALRLRHLLPMPRLSTFDRKPPLSMLTAAQLLDLAREFRDMASTSSTPEVQRSLNVLAARYAGLAAQREIQERGAVRH